MLIYICWLVCVDASIVCYSIQSWKSKSLDVLNSCNQCNKYFVSNLIFGTFDQLIVSWNKRQNTLPKRTGENSWPYWNFNISKEIGWGCFCFLLLVLLLLTGKRSMEIQTKSAWKIYGELCQALSQVLIYLTVNEH